MKLSEDLSKLNLAELKELQAQVERQIVKTEQNTYVTAADQIYAIAHHHGISLRELLDRTGRLNDVVNNREKKPARKNGPAPDRYVHPNDNKLKWSGRGRQPKWVKEQIEAGKTLDQLRIPGA